MKTNQAGVDLIKSFEGFSEKAYLCPAGVWTIGYGTTVWFGSDKVKGGDRVSRSEAELLLQHDLLVFEAGVKKLLRVPVRPNQFAALVSLAYNIGLRAFEDSTLLKLINQSQEDEAVAPQFLRWNKAGGKVLTGLTRRREAEIKLFLL